MENNAFSNHSFSSWADHDFLGIFVVLNYSTDYLSLWLKGACHLISVIHSTEFQSLILFRKFYSYYKVGIKVFLKFWENSSAYNSVFCSLWYSRKGKLWCLLTWMFWKCPKHDLSFFSCSDVLKVCILSHHARRLWVFFTGTHCYLRFAGRKKVRRPGRNTDYIPGFNLPTIHHPRKEKISKSIKWKSRVSIRWFAANSSLTEMIHKKSDSS